MKQVLERERPKDAISVLVRLIVREPNNKVVKSTLAESLQSPLGLECLYEELSTAATVASALAFLATSIKDHGAVDEAIRLYQRTLKLEPAAGSYALNLMHSLEVSLPLSLSPKCHQRRRRRRPNWWPPTLPRARCLSLSPSLPLSHSQPTRDSVVQRTLHLAVQQCLYCTPPPSAIVVICRLVSELAPL